MTQSERINGCGLPEQCEKENIFNNLEVQGIEKPCVNRLAEKASRGDTAQQSSLIEPSPGGSTAEQRPRGSATEQRPGGSATEQPQGGSATEQRPRGSATEQRPGGSATEQRPGGSATEQRPRGSATEHRTGGSATEQRPGGSATEQRPGGSATEQRPGGSATEQRPRGSATEQRPDGNATEQRPGGSATEQRTGGSAALDHVQSLSLSEENDASLGANECVASFGSLELQKERNSEFISLGYDLSCRETTAEQQPAAAVLDQDKPAADPREGNELKPDEKSEVNRTLRRTCSEKLSSHSWQKRQLPHNWSLEAQQQLRSDLQPQQLLQRRESEKTLAIHRSASFSSPLYRGFLLRHARRSRDQLQPITARLAAAAAGCASGVAASHKHVLTPRDVKNRSRRKTMVSIHTIF